MRDPENAHWRDSARTAKFFGIDARAAFPFLLFLIHMRWWTFFICLFTTAFFGILNKFGFSPPVFLRWLKVFFGGKQRLVRSWWTPRD